MVDGKRTILFSTHITSDLDRIADYIVLIDEGKILFDKPIYELQEQYALVKGSTELLDPDTEAYFIKIDRSPNGFQALTKDATKVKEVFGNHVVIEEASLEEIMFYMKGADSHYD